MKFETPKPNQFYYKLYMFLGMLRHPRRLWNFIKYTLSNFNTSVNYLPTMMDLEPSQTCNFHCLMCTPFKNKRANMTLEEFKAIVDSQHGLIEIKIQGVGEPLLNKDFIPMIEYARRKMLWVRTTTNGSLLHLQDNYKRLVNSGVHDINISIDGVTKPVYESIRIGGNYEQICTNCRLINDYNSRVRKTVVRAWVLMQKQNKHQFLEFPEFFAGLGFKEMTISFAMHNYGREGDNNEAEDCCFSDQDFEQFFRSCSQAGIKPSFFFHPRFSAAKFCQIPFKRIYVTTDSHVLPCCYIANQEVVDFGHYQDFDDIWFRNYTAFRHALKEGKAVPGYCQKCYGGNT